MYGFGNGAGTAQPLNEMSVAVRESAELCDGAGMVFCEIRQKSYKICGFPLKYTDFVLNLPAESGTIIRALTKVYGRANVK